MKCKQDKLNGALKRAKEILKEKDLSGWLIYDFRFSNDLAHAFLHTPKETLLTRRLCFWIPAEGDPTLLIHAIEQQSLPDLPGRRMTYRTHEELNNQVKTLLNGSKTIIMEYSPNNTIPYISKVDAGTYEWIKGFGVDVQSSGDVLNELTSVWTWEQLKTHIEAAEILNHALDSSWELIKKSIETGLHLTEWDIQQHILEIFKKSGAIAEDPPIVAFNANSANPHYQPDKDTALQLKKGDWVLIDISCKKNHPDAVYADITRVATVSDRPTAYQEQIFSIVDYARDAAFSFVEERFKQGIAVKGFEVDRLCRDLIDAAGFGELFIHRTGHHISTSVHGPGAHLDDYETHDERQILPATCFSIEPGIYLPGEFGVRLEDDIFITHEGEAKIFTHPQKEIICLL